ncbi:MAG: hypothetical protein ABGY75_15670 [Gemmataceae bacterium]
MPPLPASAALDAYYLEARSKLLDVAAIFDRIDRGVGADAVMSDPRIARLRAAVEALLRSGPRAERVQHLFSLQYDPNWSRPEPR